MEINLKGDQGNEETNWRKKIEDLIILATKENRNTERGNKIQLKVFPPPSPVEESSYLLLGIWHIVSTK